MLALSIPGLSIGRDGVYVAARGEDGPSRSSSATAGPRGGAGRDPAAARAARDRDVARVAAWAAGIVRGEVEALKALMDAYTLSLTRFAATIVSSSSLAEEVVQDVFVSVWDHRATLDPADNMVGYLYRAVRNRALNVAQQERTRSMAEAQAFALQPAKTDNRALAALDAEALQDEVLVALRTVAPRCREIFWMVLEGHMRYDEVAAAIGISTRSVQNQYYKAVAALALHFNARQGNK